MSSKLAIVIVNWNVRDLLGECLTAVYADLAASGLQADVWVVDNASHDGSPEMIRGEFDQVRLIVSEENLGFAGGNNLALRQIGRTDPPHFVLLLNPDTELRPGVCLTLTQFMQSHPQVGIAGARLFYADGGFQHSAFHFPGLWQILFDLFPPPRRLYESRLNGRYSRELYRARQPFPVDHPLGAAMMVRWELTRQVGFFDEAFHMYCEEIDWCLRIKQRGWQIYCVPGAEVVHYEGQSASQIREESFVELWRSRRRLYEKHYGPAKRWLATGLVRAGMKRKTRLTRRRERGGEIDRTEAATLTRAYSRVLAAFDSYA